MTKANSNQLTEALDYFEKSEKVEPSNSLNKFQKGNVLVQLERYEEALEVYLSLLQQVPKEAPIHIQIGKIYKRLGNVDLALKYFNKALDLDPKDTNMVKGLIDKIHSAVGAGANGGDIAEDADI
jgi:anaphase-promoting complex subunit 3